MWRPAAVSAGAWRWLTRPAAGSAMRGSVKEKVAPGPSLGSAEAFLASDIVGKTRCLVLDISMPGMSGPELQRELRRRQRRIPVVFITAHASEAARPRLLSQGAVACLFKPFDPAALLAAINTALRAA